MAVEDHPLYEAWSEAYRDFLSALNQLDTELKKGGGGLIEAAKLDLKKATEKYDAIRDQL